MEYLIDATTTRIPPLEILMRFLLASAFGAIIGFDREVKNRPAGLRTHMLTALASAVFTVLTLELYYQLGDGSQGVSADPIRIIEAVTAGVAFLAAGTIIHGSGKVSGLTTGAGMWLAGALGVACGGGFYVVAGMALMPAIVIISALRMLERRIPNKRG